MKDDRSFLDGIYQKADDFTSGDVKPDGFNLPKICFVKRYAGITAAVLFVTVVASSLYFSSNQSYPMRDAMTSDIAGVPSLQQEQKQKGVEPVMPIEAGEMYELPVTEMAMMAETVVIAKVKKIEKSVYESDGQMDNQMSTTVHLNVVDTLKGDVDKRFAVKISGGFDPEKSYLVPYEAVFQKGEYVLLFLTKPENKNPYTLTGSAAGKFTLSEDTGDLKKQQIINGAYQNQFGITITAAEVASLF